MKRGSVYPPFHYFASVLEILMCTSSINHDSCLVTILSFFHYLNYNVKQWVSLRCFHIRVYLALRSLLALLPSHIPTIQVCKPEVFSYKPLTVTALGFMYRKDSRHYIRKQILYLSEMDKHSKFSARLRFQEYLVWWRLDGDRYRGLKLCPATLGAATEHCTVNFNAWVPISSR